MTEVIIKEILSYCIIMTACLWVHVVKYIPLHKFINFLFVIYERTISCNVLNSESFYHWKRNSFKYFNVVNTTHLQIREMMQSFQTQFKRYPWKKSFLRTTWKYATSSLFQCNAFIVTRVRVRVRVWNKQVDFKSSFKSSY